MTGIEYFQKYGWSHAVQSVSRIPSEYNEYSPDLKTVVVNGNFRYAMAAEISKKKTEVYVTELKQIIESEKLLEDLFNLNLVDINN
jgi:alpha-N-acetylglucosamine transferase